MSLNIKNESVHAMVRELARRTGTSQTSAVEDAVRHRLEELTRATEPQAMRRDVDEVMQLAREIREGMTDDELARLHDPDHGLYDENGLPA